MDFVTVTKTMWKFNIELTCGNMAERKRPSSALNVLIIDTGVSRD